MGEDIQGQKAIRENILIGGTHIDFGWLLQFVARSRVKSELYKHIIVACEEQYVYLFKDFAHKFEFYKPPNGIRDRWLFNGKPPLPPKEILRKYKNVKLFYPNEDRCKRKNVSWFKYGTFQIADVQPDSVILIHARNLPKVHYDKKHGIRNWATEKWENLVSAFPDHEKYCVGTTSGARHIKGTIDIRGIPLEDLCNRMSNAKVIVGESSGPLHLASLCACPQVVITHAIKEDSLGGKYNRNRYETLWNPFNTKVTVLDKWSWNPKVETVIEAVKRYL